MTAQPCRRGAAILAAAIALASAAWVHAGLHAQSTGGTPRSVWDGVYTEAQAKRGAQLYTAQCASCHLESLEGDGPATPLTGPAFAANWDGVSLADLLERTRTTMPHDKPGTLSRQQVADVLAHVLSVNKFPAGDTELPRQAEVLSQIKFVATRLPNTR